MLWVDIFSKLLDFSTDDVDVDISSIFRNTFNSFARAKNDDKPELNVFVLTKGLFAEGKAQFPSTLFELVIEPRRIGWVGVVQLLCRFIRLVQLLLLLVVVLLVVLMLMLLPVLILLNIEWWCGLQGLHVCALRPEQIVEGDAIK